MQALRLMGMPDKIIAFDELPEELIEGLEMREPVGPTMRPWRDWLGKKKKITKISPERDPHTKEIRTFAPIIEEGPFFYMIDETMNFDMEKWEAICSYVKVNCPKEFRLKDNIMDMAIKLAADERADINIEPEDVVVIPLPKKKEEDSSAETINTTGQPFSKKNPATTVVKEEDIASMSHDAKCKSNGRGGRYSDGCSKCEIMKLRREPK